MPNPTDPQHWIDGYLNGELSAEDGRAFEHWLLEDPQHVERLARAVLQDTQLRAAIVGRRIESGFSMLEMSGRRDDEQLKAIDQDIMNELVDQALAARRQHEIEDAANALLVADQAEAEKERRFAIARQQQKKEHSGPRVIIIPEAVVWLGLAAVLGIAATVFYQINRAQPDTATPPIAEQTPEPADAVRPVVAPVADLTDSFDAAWLAAKPTDRGGMLPGTYTLTRGWAEVRTTQGVDLVLEAPVTFELTIDNAIVLSQGQLVAEVPEQAHGFTVWTPGGRVIDYGTTFGVAVNDAGGTLAHVFRGEVEVKSKDTTAPSVRLNRDEAASVRTGGTVARELAQPSVFVREVPATAYQAAVMRSRPMCYWRGPIDETTSLIADHGWLGAHGQASASMRNSDEGFLLNDPTGSLDFGVSEDTGVSVPFREEFVFQGPFTIEVWCWIEPGHTEFMRILSTRTPTGGVGLGVNGRITVAEGTSPNCPAMAFFGKRDVYGTQPLPEGQWSHLAATFDRQGQVRMYLNGVEMAVTTIGSGAANATNPQSTPLMIGRNPYTGLGVQAWEGKLDEVSIYARALDPGEVAEHYDVYNAQ